MTPTQVLIRPVITEKALLMQEQTNTYVFVVERRANKNVVREAVETLYDVDVESVRIVLRKGKPRRTRNRRQFGRTAATKRAYITVKEGQTIPVVQGV